MNKKRWLILLVGLVGIISIAPAYVRVYRVAGSSDAPSFLVSDRVLVNKAAYDFRPPYTIIVLFTHSDPRPGDVVMYRSPAEQMLVFKRVVGCPGDVVAMRENRLEIDGMPLSYELVDEQQFRHVADINHLGEIVELETGHGHSRMVTYTPGASPHASFEPVKVPQNRFFVIGDNRDHSKESRGHAGAYNSRSSMG